jgi:CRISPR/Cas system-associated exonuclease Cas4 (RecB family)
MLSGHIFSAYLACPLRAWMDLRGDKGLRLFSPMFLRGLQRDGLRHEREAEAKFFLGATRLDDALPLRERIVRTEQLMRKGTPAILQGGVGGIDGAGVVDVLEHAGADPNSRFGHRYRVGEIKSAASLHTGHVFQAMWYRDLLLEMSGTATDDVFFIAAGLIRKPLQAELHKDSYLRVLNEVRLLQRGAAPSEHLCSHCPSCAWRGVCLPRMTQRSHLSLLPRLGRIQCQHLVSEGLESWRSVAGDVVRASTVLGLDAYDRECIAFALGRLTSGGAVTHELLNWTALKGLVPMAVDTPLDDSGMPPIGVIPTSLWTTPDGCVQVDGTSDARLASLLCRDNTLVYGEADIAGLRKSGQRTGPSLEVRANRDDAVGESVRA